MTYELRHLCAAAALTVTLTAATFHPAVAALAAVCAVWLHRDRHRPASDPLSALGRCHHRIKETTHDG